MELGDEELSTLAIILQLGLLPRLQELTFVPCRRTNGVTSPLLLMLARALRRGHAPCLKYLRLSDILMTGKDAGAIVGAVLVGCPALTELILPGDIPRAEQNVLKGVVGQQRSTLSIHYY